ncbi:redoxin domain-containing protein [Bacillus suaedae]|uniref:Redoxin domain-containing protein n=1 Tax=Halalkalibacter suaedae TaxID=2822140 RepID=A0A941AMS2_9BACI|nr:redoxin domain-containing protein [Bacillus suaedae]MBP3949527.1 redoxin domain-containing protein [Bacillus suaedae]
MKRRNQAFYRSVLIILLCGVGFMYSQSETVYQRLEESVAATVQSGVQVGQVAVPFSLNTLSGEEISLEDYAGKNVVLHFFATWCSPCQDEMPLIVEMEKRLKQEGRELVVVNLTSQEQSKSDIRPFLQYFKATFDPLLDEKGEVMKAYQVIGIPTTLVINEEGIIVERINGGLSKDMMEELIFTN